MDTRIVSLDLMEFVERNILPRYNNFDKAHNLNHANNVIKNSLALALSTGADINMAYTIAAYHDLGLEGPRAIHHISSGKILMADRRLRRWFSEEQIKIMKEAVEDHRASASHAPRSIYGKIVAEADRDLEPEHIFRRTIQYGLSHYPEKLRKNIGSAFCSTWTKILITRIHPTMDAKLAQREKAEGNTRCLKQQGCAKKYIRTYIQ